MRYRSRRVPDTELRERLRSLAEARRRFGYRRLFVLLRRGGERFGKNRIQLLYREEGLAAIPETLISGRRVHANATRSSPVAASGA